MFPFCVSVRDLDVEGSPSASVVLSRPEEPWAIFPRKSLAAARGLPETAGEKLLSFEHQCKFKAGVLVMLISQHDSRTTGVFSHL